MFLRLNGTQTTWDVYPGGIVLGDDTVLAEDQISDHGILFGYGSLSDNPHCVEYEPGLFRYVVDL